MSQQIAVVNGAYGGIGFEISSKLLNAGYSVILLGRDQNKLKFAEQHLQSSIMSNNFIETFKVDMLADSDIDTFIDFLNKNNFYPDVFVNACGIVQLGGIHDVSMEMWALAMQTNLIGVINIVTKITSLMSANKKHGSIVLINGILSRQPDANLVINSVITGAISNFAKAISKDLGQKGIRVNIINPGITRTNLYAQIKQDISNSTGVSLDKIEESVITQSPNRQIGEVVDIANAVIFLCSNQAKHINGIFLTIDGGTINSY